MAGAARLAAAGAQRAGAGYVRLSTPGGLGAALAVVPADVDVIVVHDAARPFVTPEIVRATLDALAEHGCDAAIAAAPARDTVKEVRDGVVRRTLDRSTLWAVQTPQTFRRAALEGALAAGDARLAVATDDAALVEELGGSVRVVASSTANFKVTTPHDLEVAEHLLGARRPA
jgi:2-C-methyl-D-erythritol 4-phosphate cytidylyltransferase